MLAAIFLRLGGRRRRVVYFHIDKLVTAIPGAVIANDHDHSAGGNGIANLQSDDPQGY